MSSLGHKNMQELCRACLQTIKENQMDTVNVAKTEIDSAATGINSLLLPNIYELFMLLTTYDVHKEHDDFPKRLCEKCYCRLLDYDEFRKLTVKSTEMLYEKWNSPKEGRHRTATTPEERPTNIKQENDDDILLLPELANMPSYIKPEPAFDAMDTRFVLASLLVAEEDNSEQQSYKSYGTEEEADDEELLLPNGVANNSSPSINNTDGKVVLSKRNRAKNSLHCTDCNKQFYKKAYFDAHVRGTHLGEENPFQCTTCTKAFKRYKQLFLHIKSKHLEMLFKCDYQNCEATFELPIKLKVHREIVHRSVEELTLQNNLQELKRRNHEFEIDHICYICRRKYSSKRALTEHIKRHNEIKEHVCQECGVAKVTSTELRTHMRTHMPNLEKFPCPQCSQVFNHKNAISRHVRVVHEGLRPYSCKFCSKQFGTRNSQLCHERLHTGERPYSCETCKKGFAQREGLRSHMKNHDKKLRKHVCKICSQRFITVNNLVSHERRHLGDKPHICNICSKGFHNEKDLKLHRCLRSEATASSNQIQADYERRNQVENEENNKRASRHSIQSRVSRRANLP